MTYIGQKHVHFLRVPFFNKLSRQYFAKKYIKEILRNAESDTILYLRYSLPLFLLPFDLSNKRKCKIVIECNSIELNEQKESGFRLLYLRELILGKEFRKRCDAIVGVTDEITQYQVGRSGNSEKPYITIGNGYDVNSVPVRHPTLFNERELHLLCVANVSHWHGLDRLIRGLAIYHGSTTVKLHIAGEGAEVSSIQKLTNEMGISDHVIFHGFTTGTALDTLFNTCHIAVGSLGIHRIGLTESSTLKAREYCARGIPYIIACKDPDFPDDYPYIYRIPPDETPLNIKEVVEFTKSVYADPDHPQKMRRYADEHLDWSVKMKQLKIFLKSLVNES
jgi:glycosyltransferase involved in cell wall biosynthesis